MPPHSAVRVAKKPLRLDDELQFIRSWIDKPLRTGAVMPSSKALARAMARASGSMGKRRSGWGAMRLAIR